MEEKAQRLYEGIHYIGFYDAYYREGRYLEQAKGLIPLVEEFAGWFLGEGGLGLGEEWEAALKENLVGILRDIRQALEEGDRVLLMDALEQGVAEYLEMFLPESYFEEREAVHVEKQKG